MCGRASAFTHTQTRTQAHTQSESIDTYVPNAQSIDHRLRARYRILIYMREARVLLDTRLSGSSSSLEALRAPRHASRRGSPASIPAGRVLGPRDSPRVPPRSSRRRPVASRSLLDPCRGVRGLFTMRRTRKSEGGEIGTHRKATFP